MLINEICFFKWRWKYSGVVGLRILIILEFGVSINYNLEGEFYLICEWGYGFYRVVGD